VVGWCGDPKRGGGGGGHGGLILPAVVGVVLDGGGLARCKLLA
jgi:hypothetical protein